ncbi:hypothetical protein [Brachyspira catarrhinii]|uniref:Lipocalin-like domain-containing protein n=1 Tax=Brachyspira catarrhinii TaxID=2528966 RepID=A0ABY2TP94_9SPIR|nr:hypothetical protein [Brachyspira catarrhinii]TKZ32531.1 hypothetical protein EZH24_09155 [Brachyspira catarrhinii]
MKNSKKLFLIILSVLVVVFVSCKDKGTDPAPTTFKVSYIAGTWTGDGVEFTISDSGNMTMTSPATITFQIPEADWNSEKTEYTINGDDVGISGASITFTSATSGTATSADGTTAISKQ